MQRIQKGIRVLKIWFVSYVLLEIVSLSKDKKVFIVSELKDKSIADKFIFIMLCGMLMPIVAIVSIIKIWYNKN